MEWLPEDMQREIVLKLDWCSRRCWALTCRAFWTRGWDLQPPTEHETLAELPDAHVLRLVQWAVAYEEQKPGFVVSLLRQFFSPPEQTREKPALDVHAIIDEGLPAFLLVSCARRPAMAASMLAAAAEQNTNPGQWWLRKVTSPLLQPEALEKSLHNVAVQLGIRGDCPLFFAVMKTFEVRWVYRYNDAALRAACRHGHVPFFLKYWRMFPGTGTTTTFIINILDCPRPVDWALLIQEEPVLWRLALLPQLKNACAAALLKDSDYAPDMMRPERDLPHMYELRDYVPVEFHQGPAQRVFILYHFLNAGYVYRYMYLDYFRWIFDDLNNHAQPVRIRCDIARIFAASQHLSVAQFKDSMLPLLTFLYERHALCTVLVSDARQTFKCLAPACRAAFLDWLPDHYPPGFGWVEEQDTNPG